MSSVPELSPRSNSGPGSPPTAARKYPRAEDPDQTVIHSPRTQEGSGPNSPAESGGEAESKKEEPETSAATDDLLVQLPDYDWAGFMARFEETLKDVGAGKERLSREYDMWNWMYEIWSSSRDRVDTRRLSQEYTLPTPPSKLQTHADRMATIIQWTKLKEADLERAREAHTQSMLAISSVLGIIPKNATPPPIAGKKQR